MSELDELRDRVEYLEGLTDGDVKLITKLQEELNLYKLKYKGMCEINQFNIGESDKEHKKLEASQEALGKTFNKLADNQQKLKTVSRMLDEWEKTTSHPDATLINIRNLKKVVENTETIK